MTYTVTTTTVPRLSREQRRRRNQAAIEALRSFRDGDEAEQRETGEYLLRALDEDRPASRKLFAAP